MINKPVRPTPEQVTITDAFWAPYLRQIREVTAPYVFDKFEETDVFRGFRMIIENYRVPYGDSNYFDNALVYESMRGAYDFMRQEPMPQLEQRLESYIEMVKKAQDCIGDGFISPKTVCVCPDQRWGQNGGDIVAQHDLYNHGALVDAAISHYLATGRTNFLEIAVKSANLICSYIGLPPKNNIIPGHSLPEEAFIRLYRLFRDHRELDGFAAEHNVDYNEYLRIVLFWYDIRGNYTDRSLTKIERFTVKYNQDHLPFGQQTTAEGHAVRAALCYAGAAMAAYETGRKDYETALDAIWNNITQRKLHISGGIGTREDIEGFDEDYSLPHDAYLETCAAIAMAFFNGEMALLGPDGKYFDCFERSLYNNILASIGQDGTHYFYQNPLVSDGSISRWPWHGCPCCPPMLLKLYSTLGTYIYAYRDDALWVNMLIDSRLTADGFAAKLENNRLTVKADKPMTLHLRIPAYAENFTLLSGGQPAAYRVEKGYAVLENVTDCVLELRYSTTAKLVFCNEKAEAPRGQAAVMLGTVLYCAEGFDNDRDVAFTVAADPELQVEGNTITGKRADGGNFKLIPYHLWCHRESENQEDRKMAVWFPYAGQIPENPTDALYFTR